MPLAPDDLVATALLAELAESLVLHGWCIRIRIPYGRVPLPAGWRGSREVHIETVGRGPEDPGSACAPTPAGPRDPVRGGCRTSGPGGHGPELLLRGIRWDREDGSRVGDGWLRLRPAPPPTPDEVAPLAAVEVRLRGAHPIEGWVPLGTIPEDPALWQALAVGRPVASVRPGSALVREVRRTGAALHRRLAEALRASEVSERRRGPVTCQPVTGTP